MFEYLDDIFCIWTEGEVNLQDFYNTSAVLLKKNKFTTKNFKLDKGAHQGDHILHYLFIFLIEKVFTLIKENKDIHRLTFFDHIFLYTAYADDTTSFLKDKESVKEVMNVFDTLSICSGLNLTCLNAKFLALAS